MLSPITPTPRLGIARVARVALVASAPLLLGGCLAKTAWDVATAPVRAVGQVVDWTTTSSDEADRNRGREIRRLEERYGELTRRYEDQTADCQRGDERDCERRAETWEEMQTIRRQIPQQPD